MNMQPTELSTVELITQQALEINRLNYKCSRLSDTLAETWHPEFGSMWRYKEVINDCKNLLHEINNKYKIRCRHIDLKYDPNCLCCEMIKVLEDVKTCAKVIPINN